MFCIQHVRTVSSLSASIRMDSSALLCEYSRNISMLFDNAFLQDGHIASSSSCFVFWSFASSAGVESEEAGGLWEVSKMNFTGISCLRLEAQLAATYHGANESTDVR